MSPAPCELPDGKSVGFALYKILLMTEPAVQEHAKEFIRRFYLRRNRYTGLSLFEDPQFALLGLVNEISIGYHNRILSRFMREPYYTTIDNDFQGYLRERKIAAKRFDPEFNDRDSAEYWNWKLRRSYAMWSAFVRELGYKGPICGSNYAENIFHVEPSLGGDYLDAHMYWGYADWLKGKLRPVGENMWSILLQEPFNSGYYTKQTFARFSQASVPGYPLICSENRTSSGGGVQWGKGTPDLYSAYRAVGIPFLATVQAFQEWDGFYTFASQGPERLGDPPRMNHTLDLRFDTVCLGTTPFSAYLLRGNVIRPARRKVLLRYSGNELFGSGRFNPTFFSDVLFQMPERHKTEVSYPGMNVPEAGYDRVFEYGRNDALPEVRRNPVVEADTGEFYRNWREGFFVVKAPAVQGAEGFFLKTKRFELPDFVLTVKSDFGIFFIAAREGIPLSRAPRMMFFAGGECANTHKPGEQKALYGWSYSGTAPVQLKPVAGTLEAGSGRFDVWSLGERGERLAKVAENVGAFEFDTGRDRTIGYELERRQGR